MTTSFAALRLLMRDYKDKQSLGAGGDGVEGEQQKTKSLPNVCDATPK